MDATHVQTPDYVRQREILACKCLQQIPAEGESQSPDRYIHYSRVSSLIVFIDFACWHWHGPGWVGFVNI